LKTRTRENPEAVHAKVVRCLGTFILADEIGGKQRSILCFNDRARVARNGRSGLWFTDEVVSRPAIVGERIFAKIVLGNKGWKAVYWGFKDNALVPESPRVAEGRIKRFFDEWMSEQDKELQLELTIVPDLRRTVCEMFAAYARERVAAFVDDVANEGDRRYWTAIASVEFAIGWPKHIGEIIGVEMPSDPRLERGLASLRADPKPERTSDIVEQVVRKAMELRDADTPFYAEKVLEEVFVHEHKAVEDAVEREYQRLVQGKRQCSILDEYRGDFTTQARENVERTIRTPVSDAFCRYGKEGDRALRGLSDSISQARRALERKHWKLIEQAGIEGRDQDIPALWAAAHATDPHFKFSFGAEYIWELLGAGRFETLAALRRLMQDDRYTDDRHSIDRAGDSIVIDAGKDWFAPLEQTMHDCLAEASAYRALQLYEKYVLGGGREVDFMAVAGRKELVAELRAVLPLHQFIYECGAIQSRSSGDLDELIERFRAIPQSLKNHPDWMKTQLSLLWTFKSKGMIREALDELDQLVIDYPDRVAEWENISIRLWVVAQ